MAGFEVTTEGGGSVQKAGFDLGSESVPVSQSTQPIGLPGQLQEGLGNYATKGERSILPD